MKHVRRKRHPLESGLFGLSGLDSLGALTPKQQGEVSWLRMGGNFEQAEALEKQYEAMSVAQAGSGSGSGSAGGWGTTPDFISKKEWYKDTKNIALVGVGGVALVLLVVALTRK